MNATTTYIFIGIAALLIIAALFAVPSSVAPEAFSDEGSLFYPEFTDPMECRALEVYAPDAETDTVEVFKVNFEKGLWRIPSHHGYPADAKERMATAAASLIGLKKDIYRSNRVEDQAQFGVEDPMDASASVEGRGMRIILKDGSGRTLADVILGKGLESPDAPPTEGGRQNRDWCYMRETDKKRIYAVNLRGSSKGYGGELLKDVSTKFSEWIDTDLLHLERNQVSKILVENYAVDETEGKIAERESLRLEKGDEEKWTLEGITADEQVKDDEVRSILSTLDSLLIAGVRPAPERLSQASLQQHGFFVDPSGALYGNEGQVNVVCDDGVGYYLFFGEVLFGSGDVVTSGEAKKPEGEDGKPEGEKDDALAQENRYLFVRVGVDQDFKLEAEAAIAKAEEEGKKLEAEKAAEGDATAEGEDAAAKRDEEEPAWKKTKAEWEEKLEKANKRVEELNLRFSKWYYVISDESFKTLRKTRDELVELKLPDTSVPSASSPIRSRSPSRSPRAWPIST